MKDPITFKELADEFGVSRGQADVPATLARWCK
jgi:hypothetical protein